jgi:hypothetical protein
MAGNGRHGREYRRSGVVEGEQDELLQVLPFVFEGPHLGPHARSCRRRPGRPQLRIVCVNTGPSALGAVASKPLQNQIVTRPQPVPPPRDWGELLARRGPIGTPGRAARRMHFSSTEGARGAAIPAPALQRPPHLARGLRTTTRARSKSPFCALVRVL